MLVRRARRVLVAHAEPTTVRMLRKALVRDDLRLYCARDGLEALAVARASGYPDLLITDVGLAGVDGLQLAARMASANPGMRIIVLSSLCDDIVFLDAGMAARTLFLRPPVRSTTLRELIRDMFADRRSAAARGPG